MESRIWPSSSNILETEKTFSIHLKTVKKTVYIQTTLLHVAVGATPIIRQVHLHEPKWRLFWVVASPLCIRSPSSWSTNLPRHGPHVLEALHTTHRSTRRVFYACYQSMFLFIVRHLPFLGYLYSIISYIVKGVWDLDIPGIRSLHICTIHSALTYTTWWWPPWGAETCSCQLTTIV
jgi:hypothetical protein